jgi:ribosomal protein L16 Arg81 hydroxylase
VTYKTVKQFWGHSKTLQDSTKTLDSTSSDRKSWMYFTGCLERSSDDLKEFPGLLAELPNLRGFVANDKFFASHLWLGSRGVTAQTHYDQAPNFAAQVFGHKRWILSPPRYTPIRAPSKGCPHRAVNASEIRPFCDHCPFYSLT